MIKKILFYSLLCIIAAVGTISVKTFFDVNKLEKVRDMKEFALSFDPNGKQPVEMDVRNGSWRDPFYDWHVKSSLFPYLRLESETIKVSNPVISSKNGVETDLSPEGRMVHRDKLWNVFWISIKPANQGYAPPIHYGPFRIE